MYVFNVIVPIFAIIALGMVLFRTGILASSHLETLNRLTFRVGISCFLFFKVATADYLNGGTHRVFLVILIGMVTTVFLAYVVGWFLRIEWETMGTFVQVSYRGNLAFIGLPVVIYALSGMHSSTGASAETHAILVLAPIMPFNMSMAVLVLLLSQHKLDWQALKSIAVSILKNPILIAIALGGMVGITGLHLPDALLRTCQVIGQMALPLALIAIGGAMASIRLRGNIRQATVAAILKTIAAPAIGFLAATTIDLNYEQTKIALIYLACPTAALSYVLTNQIGGSDTLAASAVVISTVLAVFSLSVILAL